MFDTSVWVDWFNDQNTTQSQLLDHQLNSGLPVFICPPIVEEVLQGIKMDRQFSEIKELILALDVVTADAMVMSMEAASLYRSCRKKGLTIRRPMDCLIAVYTMHFGLTLAHRDSDFDLIAKVANLNVYQG